MDYRSMIEDYLHREAEVLKKLDVDAIDKAVTLLEKTRKKQAFIYIFGNGGSASTASHFLCDFNRGVSEKTKMKYRFCCLNDNTAALLAIANDFGYEYVFVKQLEHRLCKNDVVVAISGSGNSENVIHAVQYAKKCGNKVIGLTGYDGGRLKRMSDISLHVPVDDMQIAEDIHLVFDHLMMSVLNKTIQAENNE